MGKVIKAFQIKIDSSSKVTVPTGQVFAQPTIEDDEEVDPALFQALSPEILAGSGHKVTVAPGVIDRPKPAPAAPPPAAAAPPPPNPTPAAAGQSAQANATSAGPQTWEELLGKLKPDSKSAKLASLYSACKSREMELVALEEQLQRWEQNLRDRETALTQKEEDAHKAMVKRRQDADTEVDRTLESARKAAASMVATSRAESEAITKTARLQIDEARETAIREGHKIGEEKGFAKGEREGLQEAKLDWQTLMQETEMLIQELQTSRMSLLKSSEEEMIHLVIAFARSVIKAEVDSREEIILRNLDAAINKVADVDKIVLRINIRDKAMCEAHKDNLLRRLGTVSDLRIIEDQTLSPGGVKIETSVGTIDATIESQTQELEQSLRKHLRQSGGQVSS